MCALFAFEHGDGFFKLCVDGSFDACPHGGEVGIILVGEILQILAHSAPVEDEAHVEYLLFADEVDHIDRVFVTRGLVLYRYINESGGDVLLCVVAHRFEEMTGHLEVGIGGGHNDMVTECGVTEGNV